MKGPTEVPLCVDLDGTLVRSDTLVESFLQLARRRPLELWRLPLWLARGRAHLKAQLAGRVRIDPRSLPYNSELLGFLRGQRDQGRSLLLVTASHEVPARAVADHVALFDEVIATDGRTNLKSGRKHDALVERFGKGGFDYAGNSSADLAVWPGAREAIVVNAPPRLLKRLGTRADKVMDSRRKSLPRLILSQIRVHQWVKNLLVFVPTVLAHRFAEPDPLLASAVAFFSFSFGASAVYVLNDLFDVEADRHHPEKRHRPFASGDLPLQAGFVLIPALGLASLGLAALLPFEFLLVLVFYFFTTTLYSVFLKEVALVDVLVLASLYTLRIYAGSAASGVAVSEWLLAFSTFIFLSLAAVKRYAELLKLRRDGDETVGPGDTKIQRRGYFAGDSELIVQMGLSSGYIAVLVLALYITSDSVAVLYSKPILLWFVCPLLLYWITRIWLLAHRGSLQEDPVSFAVNDRVTWLVAALAAVVLLAARGLGDGGLPW